MVNILRKFLIQIYKIIVKAFIKRNIKIWMNWGGGVEL